MNQWEHIASSPNTLTGSICTWEAIMSSQWISALQISVFPRKSDVYKWEQSKKWNKEDFLKF